jgi:nucleotide-binding universal stress UspA family protein
MARHTSLAFLGVLLLGAAQVLLEPHRRILIAVDFSPTSQALVQISRAVAPDAQLILLHVCADAMEAQMRYANVNESVISEYRTKAERRATSQLSELAASCGLSPGQYTGHIAHGSPARQINHLEGEHDTDLVVLGKHGTHLTEELLLGSVTKPALETTRADLLVMVDRRQTSFV